MRTITIRLPQSILISLDAENITPDKIAPLTLSQIRSLSVWQGNRKMHFEDFFHIEGDESTAKPDETLVRLDGNFSRVKRIAEEMSCGIVEVYGNIGMHAGAKMNGGLLRIQGDAGDWLGREMHGGKIIVSGNVGNYAGSSYRGEKCGMRGGEIEILGSAGAYLGEHMCGGSIIVHGDAGDFPGAVNQGGIIFIGGSTFLPGAEMTKGTITVKGQARLTPSYQKMEVVSIEGLEYQKFVGDIVENGKGEIFLANVQSP
ncbi:MAG: formylmethanofuran dehydrogenase subunit C [Methanotrichaceae archaeon]|nr:formylmethanofuran dehydrogenase subunit C [Methanotrichaceae archaeon]